MGAIWSTLSFGSEEDYKVSKAVERELALVAQHTTYEIEELRELHAAFLAQYPTGFISPQQFVDENTEAIGGPPELWRHYFYLIANPPLARRRPMGRVPGMDLQQQQQQQQHHPPSSGSDQKDAADASKKDGGGKSRGLGDSFNKENDNKDDGGPRGRSPTGGAGAGGAGGLSSSISERLAAANRGADLNVRQKTSLVSTTDLNEDLDLDPRVVGLSFSHVIIRMQRSIYNASEQKLKYLFSFFDVNQDGLISLGDLETAFEWLFQVPMVRQTALYADLPEEQRDARVRAETLLALWDRDGDGLLNQDEFVEMGRADPDLLELVTALRK